MNIVGRLAASALSVAALVMAVSAEAAVSINFTQSGTSVVVVTSGSLNTSGLSPVGVPIGTEAGVASAGGLFAAVTDQPLQLYSVSWGVALGSSGNVTFATSGVGSLF